MSITVLADVIMPSSIVAAGIRGKNRRSNVRVISNSGQMQINVNWSRTLREYELGVVPLSPQQWAQIEALHEVTEGGAYGLLLQDPKDYQVAAGSGLLWGLKDGANTGVVGKGVLDLNTYNLMKRYTVTGTSRSKDRFITRPHTVTHIFLNGTPLTGSDYTLNTATGVVTFVGLSLVATDTLTWSGTFYVPVHFVDDFIDWDMVLSGDFDARLIAGPNVAFEEVRE